MGRKKRERSSLIGEIEEILGADSENKAVGERSISDGKLEEEQKEVVRILPVSVNSNSSEEISANDRRCKAVRIHKDRQCRRKAKEGSIYCEHHINMYGKDPIEHYHEDYSVLKYGSTLDVLGAYIKNLDEEDRNFVLQVYGDTSLDAEIALLRLVIRDLLSDESKYQKYQHLPRFVSALSDAFREAVRMLEGNRLVVEFSDRHGEEYWRELFRTFQRLLEESLVPRLCSQCRDVIARFISGGMDGDLVECDDMIVADV